ncbi:MAG: hypothetical protein WD118_06020, partial [Phycisphaeraceae bacterium]
KMRMPWWNELAHTPFFVYDPRSKRQGERRQALVQPAIDLAPTLLDFFDLEPTPDMTGKVLRDTIARDVPVREAAMFGLHGSNVNVTDGRYVYMRGCADDSNGPLYEYTLMPTHMRGPFAPRELAVGNVALCDGFSFTKGCSLMKIEARAAQGAGPVHEGHRLYDLASDPEQTRPITDPAVEAGMIEHLNRLMTEVDAPAEQYQRLGLSADAPSPA